MSLEPVVGNDLRAGRGQVKLKVGQWVVLKNIQKKNFGLSSTCYIIIILVRISANGVAFSIILALAVLATALLTLLACLEWSVRLL
jgi:hypothetical protein